MADKNPSPKAQGPEHHACDDPHLSATEFLYSVMRDSTQPIRDRIKAASKLLALEPHGPPRPSLTIVIQPSQDPDRDNRNQQSFSPSRSYNPRPFLTTPGPSYIEKTLERIPLSEIIEIVSRTPEHLLPVCTICNHPMMYPCSTAPVPGEHLRA